LLQSWSKGGYRAHASTRSPRAILNALACGRFGEDACPILLVCVKPSQDPAQPPSRKYRQRWRRARQCWLWPRSGLPGTGVSGDSNACRTRCRSERRFPRTVGRARPWPQRSVVASKRFTFRDVVRRCSQTSCNRLRRRLAGKDPLARVADDDLPLWAATTRQRCARTGSAPDATVRESSLRLAAAGATRTTSTSAFSNPYSSAPTSCSPNVVSTRSRAG
jgi:hypothetical protein